MTPSHTSPRTLTTSTRPQPPNHPRAPAQEDQEDYRPPLPPRPRRPQTPPNATRPADVPATPASPAWSTASTADAGPSPSLPALPAPRLPDRVQALLRTPPLGDSQDGNQFVTASWGSPYAQSDSSHLRLSSVSSEQSEDSPIHQLELHTPFLRPAPFFTEGSVPSQRENEDIVYDDDDDDDDDSLLSSPSFSLQASSALVSAAVLANRARRPARGLTEDWIRQHTTGELGSEARLWFDSSEGDSETSSLSGSVSGDDQAKDSTKKSGRRTTQHTKDHRDDENSLRTPRAQLLNKQRTLRSPSSLSSASQQARRKHAAHHPRHPSSLETLRESSFNRLNRRDTDPDQDPSTFIATSAIMDSFPLPADGPEKHATDGGVSEDAAQVAVDTPGRPSTPTKKAVSVPLPSTPQANPSPNQRSNAMNSSVSLDPLGGEAVVAKAAASPRKTPRRVKKKVPWKGKSILVLLPLDENRGKPGKAPKPLTEDNVNSMLRSWEELGYDTSGFDLDAPTSPTHFDYNDVSSRSLSRPSWPDERDMVQERAQRKYPVQLPDLNRWKSYVDELNEAKLRALGVSFAEEEPPLPPSITPSAAIAASISRQGSVPIYPPLPFSPPIPTSSAASGLNGGQPFTFPGAFVPGAGGIMGSSAAQSPSIPSAASPIPFNMNNRFNNRQSISIPAGMYQMPPMQTTPGGYSPQALMLQQGLARGGSPSLAALSSVMSPTSPFTPDGSFSSPPLHQRHQSLQYPMMQYSQLQTSARASPRLQDLREIEEETEEKQFSNSPSKTPEPSAARPFPTRKSSFAPQNNNSAEYHLEEQFREQFEHDRDYSPHGARDAADAFGANGFNNKPVLSQHARGMSVQFAANPAPIQRFREDAVNGSLPLHHPRPHSRGHSLANAYYEPPESKPGASQVSASALENAAEDSYEVVTNPSNLGTPVQPNADLTDILHDQKSQLHQRSFSTASNPWSEHVGSFSNNTKRSSARQVSHGSKASLSSLKADAPEFKFNPNASFQPSFSGSFGSGFGNSTTNNAAGQFRFGAPNPESEPFQPSLSVFQAGTGTNVPPSATASQTSFPTSASGSKININAPTFSPGQSEFSFSSAGPKFRPDAPAFTPLHSITNSLTSPVLSGAETFSVPTNSIFGNIDIQIPAVGKAAKKSKAVPIVRPSSSHSSKPATSKKSTEEKEEVTQYDNEGRITDDSRVKRARATPMDGDNEEVLFANPNNNDLTVPSAAPTPLAGSSTEKTEETEEKAKEPAEVNEPESVEASGLEPVEDAETEPAQNGSEAAEPVASVEADEKDIVATVAVETDKPEADDNVLHTTMSSTVLSESTDAAKVPNTASPSDVSPPASALPWTPFEFRSDADVAMFDSARPSGDSIFRHKKSLSATAKPFVPGASSGVSFLSSTFNIDAAEFKPAAARDEVILPSTEPADETYTPADTPVAPMDSFVSFSSPPPPPPPAAEKPKTKGLASSRYATSSPPPPPPPKSRGLADSRYATSSPPPVPIKDGQSVFSAQQFVMPVPDFDFQDELNAGVGAMDDLPVGGDYEPTFEEIDDIMRHLNENDPGHGAHKIVESWQQNAIQPPVNLTAPSPTRSYRHLDQHVEPELPHQPMQSTELDDPFVAHQSHYEDEQDRNSIPSEWERDFNGEEQLKLESRVNFFDGHVNEIVGGILAARLNPLEKSLDRIQHAIADMTRGTPSSRRGYRSNSGEIKDSDADDEDEELPIPRRSMSPRRDRRIEQIRSVVLDALATHQSNNFLQIPSAAKEDGAISGESIGAILQSLADVKEHVTKVSEAATSTRAIGADDDKEAEHKSEKDTLRARIAELEERLRLEQAKAESEVATRRTAEDQASELRRQLELAETKIEVEIMNRSAFDQRVADLEDKLKHQEERTETELKARQSAEDKLAESERQLRVASEEETRLRTTQVNGEQTQSDLQNRLNSMESELRDKSQETRHWRAEAERAIDLSQRQGDDLTQTTTELKHLKRVVDTLGTQLEENERLREVWRTKFVALQEDMARAAREVAEESARFIKREQTLVARHEVLDAKLQAEARTRERLESELERLEGGERQAMRAVSECKRLETLLGEMRTENHKLQQTSLRYQSEFEEARESAAREVQRTRNAMQGEIDNANHQVNIAREDLEDQVSRVRAQLDQVRLDSDTAKARLEMMLEEAETTKRSALEEAERRHQNEVEDMQARYERKINNVTEDAQRSEQNLLERLSISASKTEHLQDRVTHLEAKVEIAREAAAAAAKSAAAASSKKTAEAMANAPVTGSAALQPAATVKALHHGLGLPEKISPQALRESIFVLQEQLQQREQRIEELEHKLDKVDPEAETKIAKRDDEIIWLRELLAVRHSDLKDIITALGREEHDPDRVRDAVIRLQANLQMEEQERERAMNGGSAIKLPTLAASIRDIASTPRVAQAVGPLAAAWGSWRKATMSSSPAVQSPSVSAATAPRRRTGSSAANPPRRAASSSVSSRTSRANSTAQSQAGDSSFLSGLMTPPMSKRQPVITEQTDEQTEDEQASQPTAFSNTGRRYTGGRQPAARRPSRTERGSRTENKYVAPPTSESDTESTIDARGEEVVTPPPAKFRRASREQPVTPPMMHQSAYDSDAQADEFDDPSFYED